MQQAKATRESGQALPMPEQKKHLLFERHFTQHEFDQISLGLIAHEMDDKWFIFLEDLQLSFHRSWTGHCIYHIRFEKQNEEYIITETWVNRNQEEYRNNDDDYDIALLSFLIDNFLLGKNTSFPVPSNSSDNHPKGVYQHSVSGTAYPEIKTTKNQNPHIEK
jgi:hypothetical protein